MWPALLAKGDWGDSCHSPVADLRHKWEEKKIGRG